MEDKAGEKIDFKEDLSGLLKEISETQSEEKIKEDLVLVAEQREAYQSVVKWPSKILKTWTKKVDLTTCDLGVIQDQIEKMCKVVKLLNGVGIASNQLGFNNRVCVCWFGAREDKDLVPMINPSIETHGREWVSMKEACLSCDDCVGTIRRRDWVSVTWFDRDGFENRTEFYDWNARIVQHEIDHLNGLTIIDKFSLADKAFNKLVINDLSCREGMKRKRFVRRGALVA
jgi:peptide deformylase